MSSKDFLPRITFCVVLILTENLPADSKLGYGYRMWTTECGQILYSENLTIQVCGLFCFVLPCTSNQVNWLFHKGIIEISLIFAFQTHALVFAALDWVLWFVPPSFISLTALSDWWYLLHNCEEWKGNMRKESEHLKPTPASIKVLPFLKARKEAANSMSHRGHSIQWRQNVPSKWTSFTMTITANLILPTLYILGCFST